MRGAPLGGTVATDAPVREAGLFGAYGGHVNVTDGRYVYMRAPVLPSNEPLYEHTLMPTHMAGRFAPQELADADPLAVQGVVDRPPYAYVTEFRRQLSRAVEEEQPLEAGPRRPRDVEPRTGRRPYV